MNIRKEYINKAIEYLKNINNNMQVKECLKNEIKLLREHIDAYSDRDYSFISGRHEYKGIEDLVIKEETKLCMKETQLDQIEKDEKIINIYLSRLNEEFREVIEIRYLNNKEKINSFEKVSKEMNLSEATIRRKHRDAIKKITYFKYGTECVLIEENDGIMTKKRPENDGLMNSKVC